MSKPETLGLLNSRFMYVTNDDIPVMVRAARRPSEKSVPACGTWPIMELCRAPDGITSNWVTVSEEIRPLEVKRVEKTPK